jgi:hypothetical protein
LIKGVLENNKDPVVQSTWTWSLSKWSDALVEHYDQFERRFPCNWTDLVYNAAQMLASLIRLAEDSVKLKGFMFRGKHCYSKYQVINI